PHSLFPSLPHAPPPDLPSFPTRRSSDLVRHRLPPGARVPGVPDLLLPDHIHDPEPVGVGLGVFGDLPAQLPVSRRRHRTPRAHQDRKSTRLNSSHVKISYAVFCLKKKKK